jgi:uncharacterized protein YbjT (DUF2867 family)
MKMPIRRQMKNACADNPAKLILLTGASGYVGGHLLQALETEGHRVRCGVRRPDTIRPTKPTTKVVRLDVLDRESLSVAMRSVDTAYYLVHSMNSERSFEQSDREGARNFAEAARVAGVKRIIYLGGLGDSSAALSPHLRSRHEVGELLRASGAQVIEFRASAIIGAGSLSFEMVRALAERLPIMITPRWVMMEAQPIAIGDVIRYLVAALSLNAEGNRVFEIGGADRVSYGGIIRAYAGQRGLRRAMIRVPVLTPRLSSWWLRLVTPLQARVGRELIESVYHATVVSNDLALRTFAVRPAGIEKAIADALRAEDLAFAATRWSVPRSAMLANPSWGGTSIGNHLIFSRTIETKAPPSLAFAPIRRIGGATGWYYGRWLWELRAFADRLIGGPGMTHGRSRKETIEVGDRIDFWRVSAFEPDRKLTLAAEMKVPGRAWLDFEVEPNGAGSSITQTAIFDPKGLFGLLYWYASFPLHQLVFAGMLRAIEAAALVPSTIRPAISRVAVLSANGSRSPN